MFSDAPHFKVDARIRAGQGSGWKLDFGKKRYSIRANSLFASLASEFVVASEWLSFDLTLKHPRLMSGKLFDGTPLVYRACAPYWDGEDLIAPDHLEFFVGDIRFTGSKTKGIDRVQVRDEKDELMLEARHPWQDSEAGVDWVIDLRYQLDDPNVQLALLLFPWVSSLVYSWWEYASRQSAG